MTSETMLRGILMGLAPEVPKWFEAKKLPELPEEPSKIITKYKDHEQVNRLLNSWTEDPHWDLDNTFLSPTDFPKGVSKTFREELKEFSDTWKAYWTLKYEITNRRKLERDIQWRKYWAKLCVRELGKIDLD